MVLCKIIHGDNTDGVVDLERPAAEAGQAMGTHRIMNPDERPPELPNNSEVAAVHKIGGGMTSDSGAADAVVAQPRRDEDPRMRGTDHAVSASSPDAGQLIRRGQSPARKAVARTVSKQPTMKEVAPVARKPAVKRGRPKAKK